MHRTDSQETMAGGFFNSLYCKILFCFLVKYKPLITRALGGNDASHKSVSCLDKTSTPERAFNRKKSCWSSLHKTANIVPLEIKSATDSVCSSTMSSRSVSWSLSGPGDIQFHQTYQLVPDWATVRHHQPQCTTHNNKINFLSIPALNPVSRFDESPGFLWLAEMICYCVQLPLCI
jgi:hypothetical protein